MSNIFEKIPGQLPSEIVQELAVSSTVRIERIVSRGHASPEGFWYDQERHEWVLLLKGRAGLRFLDPEETLVMEPGDWVCIPARRRHRVEWTHPSVETIWLAVHYP
ncbi:MAG: cupin domain-containing protein [Deltaproteobacteria bacterium]|nr:cupin domain-containing protein [Deltaproteobacteria bacterium]